MPRPIIHTDPASEARRAYQRDWNRKKREAQTIQAEPKTYYENNKEARLAYQKEYNEENKEQVRQKYKKWYEANKATRIRTRRPRVAEKPKQEMNEEPPVPVDVVVKNTPPKIVEKHNIKIIQGPVTVYF